MRGLTIGSRIADLYQIGVDIDEAPGGFARAFMATNGDGKQRALKVFRAEHFSLPEERCYAYYRTLANEADLLVEMQGHPNVVRLYDMGFIWPDGRNDQFYEAQSYGMDAQAFTAAMDESFERRRLPYLVLQRMPSNYSLFRLVRRNPHSVRLPTEDVLGISLQLAAFLVDIHGRDILYWDPKPEHVYWDGERVVVIDWNVSRRIQSFEANDKAQDIQLVAQRVIYPVLLGGTSYATGARVEATPGSAPDPIARDRVDYRWQEKWLDDGVRRWLDPALLGHYRSASDFLHDVQACAVYYGWDVGNGEVPNEGARQCRASMRRGLDKVRQAQRLLEEASRDFAESSIGFLPAEYREPKRLSRLVRDLLEDGWILP